MNPRYRIYAAAGLGGVLLLVGAFLLLGRGQSPSSAAPKVIKPLHAVKKSTLARQKAKASRQKAASKKAGAKTPLAPPKVSKTEAATDGMPAPLSAALAKNPVVVVSLVLPDAPVDEMAYAEAKAGAARAGAGFVRISAASNDNVQALSTLIDSSADAGNRLLDAPAVLVFRKPQELYVRINGFIDADTVAQAAENAAPGELTPARSALADPWVAAANSVCDDFRKRLVSSGLPTSANEVLPWVEKLARNVKATVAALHALKPPKVQKARVAAMLSAYDEMLQGLDRELAAAKRHDMVTIALLDKKTRAAGTRADAIAAELGATSCGGLRS